MSDDTEVVELVVALAVDGSVVRSVLTSCVSSSETRFQARRWRRKTYRNSLLEVRNGEPGGGVVIRSSSAS
jgi:hypothetical protein